MAAVKLADKEVGSIVKLNVDGVPTEFIVVHQGLPGEMYDESCDGTWLLMKDCYEAAMWHKTSYNSYSNSSIHRDLNSTFLDLLDPDIQSRIKEVKIPYRAGSGFSTTVTSGADGLPAKVFLLSVSEVGSSNKYAPTNEGATLSYFNGCADKDSDPKRIATLNGSTEEWWLRSPYCTQQHGSAYAFCVNRNGYPVDHVCTFEDVGTGRPTVGVRPALVFPSSLSVSDSGTISMNTAPATPKSITMPENVNGGQSLTITWGESTDLENNLAGYELERQVDGGEWEAVYTGPELSFTDAITKGWQTVAYRVRAYDSAGAYSGYAVSETRTVNNNTAPEISCEFPANTPLGVKSEGFEISYSVSDEDGDAVTVTEAVDGAVLRTLTAEPGAEQRLQLTGEAFMRLLNGAHTLTITADDGRAGTVHALTFTKEVTRASVTLAAPMEADGAITVCVLSVSGELPEDGEFAAEVTNNAKDAAPVWEDCTAAVQAGTNHVFANKTAENGFAFNFRVRVGRGESDRGGCITSVQGGFQ